MQRPDKREEAEQRMREENRTKEEQRLTEQRRAQQKVEPTREKSRGAERAEAHGR